MKYKYMDLTMVVNPITQSMVAWNHIHFILKESL